MSKSVDDLPQNPSDITPQDFFAYVRGQATVEQSDRVQLQLKDPDSELNAWLRGVQHWLKDAFPKGFQSRSPMVKLDAVLSYIEQKHKDQIITHSELAQIYAVGGIDNISKFPRTPSEGIRHCHRMQ